MQNNNRFPTSPSPPPATPRQPNKPHTLVVRTMDSSTSIIDQQRTYYFNGTYDEVISNDQPKPPPMLPHGDDINAVPKRDTLHHNGCRQKWSERRKIRDNKRKRIGTAAIDSSITAKSASSGIILKKADNTVASSNSVDDDDAKKALPASAIPEGFPEELVFRTLAAYATLRTLSVQLRLSPFTPTAFLRAIYLPFPNRLLGSVHVHILRILLHNLQLGYNWKESATAPPPLDIVKKRKIDHIKWPLRAGDNLRFLDMHTWPIFYDDYCHLTADITYASLHDISDHLDLRSLNLYNIVDRFTLARSEEVSKPVPQYRDDTHHYEFDDVVVLDSDEEYKVEDDNEDDDHDAFDYDDESYGRSKKKKRKSKTTKTKQPKNLPKTSTTSAKGTTTGTTKAYTALPFQHQMPKKTHSFSQSALGVKPTLPPQSAAYHHQQRQKLLSDREHPHKLPHPSVTHPLYPNATRPHYPPNATHPPYPNVTHPPYPDATHPQYPNASHQYNPGEPILNVSPFHRKPSTDKGTNYHQYQQVHRSIQHSEPIRRTNTDPISYRPVELKSIHRTMSQDPTIAHKSDVNSLSEKTPQRQNVEFTVLHDVDSEGKRRDIIVLDSPSSSSEEIISVKNTAEEDKGIAVRSRRFRKNSMSRSYAGTKELNFFKERYGLKNPPNDELNSSRATKEGSDFVQNVSNKRSRDDDSYPQIQLEDLNERRVQVKDNTKPDVNVSRNLSQETSFASNGFDRLRVHADQSFRASNNLGNPHHTNVPAYHSLPYSVHANNSFYHGHPPHYYDRPTYYEYGPHSMHPPYQPHDFSTRVSGQMYRNPRQHDNMIRLQPSPVLRADSMQDDSKNDHDTLLANIPVDFLPPGHPQAPELKNVALSNGGVEPSVSNITSDDQTVSLRKSIESTNGDQGARLDNLSKTSVGHQVSELSTVAGSSHHSKASSIEMVAGSIVEKPASVAIVEKPASAAIVEKPASVANAPVEFLPPGHPEAPEISASRKELTNVALSNGAVEPSVSSKASNDQTVSLQRGIESTNGAHGASLGNESKTVPVVERQVSEARTISGSSHHSKSASIQKVAGSISEKPNEGYLPDSSVNTSSTVTSLFKSLERVHPQQPGTSISLKELKNGALSSGANEPSVPNIASDDRTISLQKSIEGINRGNSASLDKVSKNAVEPPVSQPNIISGASQDSKSAALENVVSSVSERPKVRSPPHSLSNASSTAASLLQAFIRGQNKSTEGATNVNQAIFSECTNDSVTFPIDEPENWSHFDPLMAMRMGSPYHTLSVHDKLKILEFLIDELLSVAWVANEFTSRHDANAQYGYPYGLKPSDAEMQAVKEADGDQHDELCKVCSESGDVVCCDGCVAVYHGECAGFLNASKLPDIWYCPECAVKDPSALGPLRAVKKSEVDWFTIADINATERSSCEKGPGDQNGQAHSLDGDSKFLVVHGYVFSQDKCINLNGRINFSSRPPSVQKVLAPNNLKDILKSFGQTFYAKWPIEQIPINSSVLWSAEHEPERFYFNRPESFDPTVYVNKYNRAPIRLEGIRRSKESYVYEEKILNDSSSAYGMVDLLSSDVSKDGAILVSISSNPKVFDALQAIKSGLLKIENDLSKAFLLDELWDVRVREMTKSLRWKVSVKQCNTVRGLSRLLLQLVDATHHRAFIETWTHSLVANSKSKDGVPSRRTEDRDSGSAGCSLRDASLHRYWASSRLCHLPTLLLKTSKYMSAFGQKSGMSITAHSPKRKPITRKLNRDVFYNSDDMDLGNVTVTGSVGDSENKHRSRSEFAGTDTSDSSSNLTADSRLVGFIRRRVESFIRESKQLVHREVHWPVAGKKLFDPVGYLPALSVRYLGRNGGGHFAPFVDYSTLHEVGQVAYCHVWRKQVSLCTQFEHLAELVRILVVHLNNTTISKCASFANGGKPVKGKSAIAIQGAQRDLLTGVDYYLVGIGPAGKPKRWESSIEVDFSVLVQERVRRSKCFVDALNKKRQAEAMLQAAVPKPQNNIASKNFTESKISTQKATVVPNSSGFDHQNATTLAAKIITAHIEETKRLIQIHGAGLSTGHLITLRKKTDNDLSKVLVGNFSFINESGRVEMIKKAEDSALESMRQATGSLSQSESLSTVLTPDTNQIWQATMNAYPVANSATSQSIELIDLNEIMKTGSPFDWSKKVVQVHKEFTRFLCLKYGQSTFPDSALDGSRHECIDKLFTVFKTAGIRYGHHQISAVIKEAENEARADFLASSKTSSEVLDGPFVSPPQQQAAPTISNATNTQALQNLLTTQNATNPYVESGASRGTNNNVFQSQNTFQSTLPTTGANVTSNVAFQTTNNNYWHPQQPTINVNPTVQPWQMTNCSGVASQIGTYSTNPQQQQSSFLQPYNANRTEQNNNISYAAPPFPQQQQTWLSSQQHGAVPASTTIHVEQQQQPQQAYNMGTLWPSTMSSSIQAPQQQMQYHPQLQQNWQGEERLWSQQQQQQQPQYQPQNNNNNNWNAESNRGR